jgi:hypothetical protein
MGEAIKVVGLDEARRVAAEASRSLVEAVRLRDEARDAWIAASGEETKAWSASMDAKGAARKAADEAWKEARRVTAESLRVRESASEAWKLAADASGEAESKVRDLEHEEWSAGFKASMEGLTTGFGEALRKDFEQMREKEREEERLRRWEERFDDRFEDLRGLLIDEARWMESYDLDDLEVKVDLFYRTFKASLVELRQEKAAEDTES